MNTIIDITTPLGNMLPVWPGGTGIHLETVHRSGENYHERMSRLSCDVHAGTHIDAPLHFLSEGKDTAQIPLDVLIGEALVVDVQTTSHITAADLESLGIPGDTKRLLLRTKNSSLWDDYGKVFREDYIALTPEAAEWIVQTGIRLIGIDYLSIQPFGDVSQQTHITLLSAEIVILEGLNLSDVPRGTYELICLPLRLEHAEGVPARAVLRNRGARG